MKSFYDNRRLGKLIFLGIAAIAIIVLLLLSNSLVKDLAAQERERMNIWAQATEKLAEANSNADFEFLLAIISQNNSIPVLVADSTLRITQFRNFDLPEKADSTVINFDELSERNRAHLTQILRRAVGGSTLRELVRTNRHFIEVEAYAGIPQYIYYEDSILLRRLSYYPYIQLGVMVILALIIYSAVVYTKRAEQNRVWAGLSKESAHQLGTPISSLMAWIEYLRLAEDDPTVVEEAAREMNKDVRRLSVIADRFSKIGSVPELSLEYINSKISGSLDYMKSRISKKVEINMHFDDDDIGVLISPSLFEWVMENLTKNAVDAMEGAGRIDITTGCEKDKVWAEISDTGKGIPRKNFKTVFNPGYTTKKRGWGLGLTLVKRIIEDYHNGRIYVKKSEVGKGTTFRIELPLPASSSHNP